ncbi:hypothetical protein, partial [Aeromicrobium sp. REDSEA-S38_B2]|uniref:hypothetical protein n=1 Tax=Aeromicrobium sp. REDSEA-S38_B2 TaxID=1811528 RepID=UPI000AB8204D
HANYRGSSVPPISASSTARAHWRPSYEEWNFEIANTSAEEQTLRICPSDIDRIALDPARTTHRAFAVAFDGDSWRFGCIEKRLQAGDAVSLRAYTRPYGTPGSGRTLVLRDASGMVIPATS